MISESARNSRRVAAGLIGPVLLLFIVTMPRPLRADDSPVTKDNVTEKLLQASTAPEHEALVAYFSAASAAAASEVERHTIMMKSIRRVGGRPYRDNRNHCRNLIEANRTKQVVFEDLAAEQEIAAREAALGTHR